jgi:hypothetical protein
MSQTNHTDMQTGRPLPAQTRKDRIRGENALYRPHPQRARFRLEGISSSFDAERLERRLERQVGVIGATVNPIARCAYVAYDPTLTSPSLLTRQIEVSGFQVVNP